MTPSCASVTCGGSHADLQEPKVQALRGVPEPVRSRPHGPGCLFSCLRHEEGAPGKVQERAKVRTRKEAIKTIPVLIIRRPNVNSTPTSVRGTLTSLVFAAASRWEQEKWVACSTAGTTVPPEVHPISDLMNGMLMPSARFAIAGVQAALLITAWALWPALGWWLLRRWSQTTRPGSWTREELIAIRDTYRAKLKELKGRAC